jgi:aminopeptidase-like protein
MSDAMSSTLASLSTGAQMFRLIEELFPICRSITGEGVRKTLRRLQSEIPLRIEEVPSGQRVFDWTVPLEWNIRDAYIQDRAGNRVVDFAKSNLHVVSYSVPVRRRMKMAELRPHLHTIPERPDWIPYRTSYYYEDWGFCLSQRQLETLNETEYDVVIDSTLGPGHLTYGELCIPGALHDEILISSHVCHPSLANDNLSGIAVAVAVALRMGSRNRRYTYRFLFAPGTIGAITWLARNEATARRIRHGLILASLGDRSTLSYKRSRDGNAEIDRAMTCILRDLGREHHVEDFTPYGYDERQYCSPGFDLPVGRLARASHGGFPENHTSADNLTFISPASLEEAASICVDVLEALDDNRRYRNLNAKCEPQLGKRGLYRDFGGLIQGEQQEMAMLWTLNLSDGRHSLLDIAERSRLHFRTIHQAAMRLLDHDLLQEIAIDAGSAE